METTSQETYSSSQPSHGPSLSALIDVIAQQEQSFEQSLANQQLWAQQLADAQEAKIKAAVQQITAGAAEVSEIRLGKKVVTPEVKLEEFNSERGNGELEPQLESPSRHFSRSISRSTSLFRYPEPEVHKEHTRYSLGDHVSKSDLGNFKYDHYKGHQRSKYYHRVSRSPDDDSNPHHGRSTDSRKGRERRGASPLEGSWKRGRSPSNSKPQRYCHQDSYSPRSDRCYRTVYGRPTNDSIPLDRRPIDNGKHRQRRGASPIERSRKRERSPYKPKPRAKLEGEAMETTSQEMYTSSQPSHGPSLSALIDVIAQQEQSFEQSLANQQLWAQQLADAQEAKIKAAVQQITAGAAEVSEIRLGKKVVTPEVKLEEFNSERGNGELEPQLESPSRHFSRSISRSTSLFRYPEPEVHKEHTRYSLGDHVSKSDLGNFKYDHYKGHQRSKYYHRVSRSPDDDSNPHHGRSTDSRKGRERRGASPLEGSWKRGRSPSNSKPQRYCHQDSYSPRSDRCYRTVYGRPTNDSIPRDRRPIDNGKHRQRRGASPIERSRKRERSPYKPKPQSHGHEDSCRTKSFRRSPGDVSNRHHGRSTDSTRYREKRGASPSETGGKSEGRSKRSVNAKAPPRLASVCANNPREHTA
ncbi:serine/arginine repetitive matrix protein 1-like [Hibiscus syriacus]|uniref:serine/arginine repetitive matrix protein 1-like n=1 Tax=Hibiscus syriacus TaxID=106335 RepID=UPI001924EB50|nr:serine/arginine repetitive matrix protein 1-like [Hibiscus syriacus]XP_039011624.1 serine/arginine repetitive matrix protein 1-like [Hibiscus syriacus]XP_039011625.1 serine/arginine repetitive matrix protein 1-like [Hibiscus syriacus]